MFQLFGYLIRTSDRNDEEKHDFEVVVKTIEEAENFVKAYFNFDTVPLDIDLMVEKQGRAAFLFGNKQCIISKEML